MRKPTSKKFVIIQVLAWILIIATIAVCNEWSSRMAASVFLAKMSVTNVAFAPLNVAGSVIGVQTGWYPWKN